MNKTIRQLQGEIEYLKEKEKQVKEEETLLYKKGFEDLRCNETFSSSYNYEDLRKKLERSLEFYSALEKEGIDIDKEYFLTDDIYLSFWHRGDRLFCNFDVKDDDWIYSYFINSYSGITQWINNLINEEYSLFSGNSSYRDDYLTHDLKAIFRIIEDKEHKIDIDKKVKVTKHLIEFTKKDGQFEDVRKNVVEMIEFRFAKMKEMIDED